MTLTLLGAVLETAVEYKHLASNPARGRRRRVPPADVEQTFLEPTKQCSFSTQPASWIARRAQTARSDAER
jgi:hypothetical protein